MSRLQYITSLSQPPPMEIANGVNRQKNTSVNHNRGGAADYLGTVVYPIDAPAYIFIPESRATRSRIPIATRMQLVAQETKKFRSTVIKQKTMRHRND